MFGFKACLILLFTTGVIFGQTGDKDEYNLLDNKSDWKQVFYDSGTKNWKSKWFLDGLKATVKNSKEGMELSAGPIAGDDSCHTVLWTKRSFKGNIKIEYDFTKTDTEKSQVNILYIQATGLEPFASDISKWNDFRKVPSMKTYFDNMKCIHISYAAFDGEGNDYIRVRKYPRKLNEDFNTTTEIAPAYFDTDLFESGKTYKITIVKTNNKLYFKVKYKENERLFSWDLDSSLSVNEGRIGLRHMYTRSSMYKNFKVFTMP